MLAYYQLVTLFKSLMHESTVQDKIIEFFYNSPELKEKSKVKKLPLMGI